jgi:ATP-dependent DNA helicase PIF1
LNGHLSIFDFDTCITDKKLKYKGRTRMRIKFMHRNAIDCEVLTGTARNKGILIPRIYIPILPFNFQRTQFPIIPAFAMTINKSQRQSFEKLEFY